MKLTFDQGRLLDLMKDFHLLTGIRIVLFDDEYKLLLAWPEMDCTFCRHMKQNPNTNGYCRQSDEHSFAESSKKKKLIVYHCHAGLIEATVPLIENHIVIGYLMFGQISDAASITELQSMLGRLVSQEDIAELSYEIPLKNHAEIRAAAKILEACTFYAVYDEIIMLRRQNFTDNLRSYIEQHIQEKLDAVSIAHGLGISRSKLYLACDKYLGMGIAEYVRTVRLDKARTLLKETTKEITAISDLVGFNDYNYFCRVFKRESGISPRKYRSLE